MFGSGIWLWQPLGAVVRQAKLDRAGRFHYQQNHRHLSIGPAGRRVQSLPARTASGLSTDNAGTLVRIDPMTNKVRQKISIAPGSYNPLFETAPQKTARSGSPAGNANILTAVDASSGAVLATIPVGPKPRFSYRWRRFRLDIEPGRRNGHTRGCAKQKSDSHHHAGHSWLRR